MYFGPWSLSSVCTDSIVWIWLLDIATVAPRCPMTEETVWHDISRSGKHCCHVLPALGRSCTGTYSNTIFRVPGNTAIMSSQVNRKKSPSRSPHTIFRVPDITKGPIDIEFKPTQYFSFREQLRHLGPSPSQSMWRTVIIQPSCAFWDHPRTSCHCCPPL